MARFPYACMETMAQKFENLGHIVKSKRDKNGSRRIKINNGRWITVANAFRIIERELKQP